MNTNRLELRLALLIFSLITIISCGSSTTTKQTEPGQTLPVTSPKVQTSPAQGAPTDGQVKFSPEGEEFTVMLPGTPTTKEVSPGDNGRKMTVYSLQSPTETITITAMPPDQNGSSPEQALTNVIAGFTDSVKKGNPDAEVVVDNSKEVSPGIQQRQFHLDLNGRTPAIGRAYVTPRRMYLVVLAAPPTAPAPSESHSVFTTWTFHE